MNIYLIIVIGVIVVISFKLIKFYKKKKYIDDLVDNLVDNLLNVK